VTVRLKLLLATLCAVSGLYLIGSVLFSSEPEVVVPYRQAVENLPVLDLSDVAKNSPDKKNPIIGLFRKDTRIDDKLHFDCTAFVISDKYAMTAAHCLKDYQEPDWMTDDEFTVKDIDFKDGGIRAHAAIINALADVGLITGDFSKFNKLMLNEGPGGFYGTMGPYHACGFPWGSNPGACLPYQPQRTFFYGVAGSGSLFPGMSGGPVIDLTTGKVVAINKSVGDGATVVTPTIGLWGALEIEPKRP
jgi:Trypsin-like peptidase domain